MSKIYALTFSELSVHLATEDVEEVSRRGHICDLHVAVLMLAIKRIFGWENAGIFVAKLKVSLHSARRMLRSLAIVAMGERHDQTGALEPFDFAGRDELIDDALTIVGKVTELGFPDDQGVRRGKRISVFEAETVATN